MSNSEARTHRTLSVQLGEVPELQQKLQKLGESGHKNSEGKPTRGESAVKASPVTGYQENTMSNTAEKIEVPAFVTPVAAVQTPASTDYNGHFSQLGRELAGLRGALEKGDGAARELAKELVASERKLGEAEAKLANAEEELKLLRTESSTSVGRIAYLEKIEKGDEDVWATLSRRPAVTAAVALVGVAAGVGATLGVQYLLTGDTDNGGNSGMGI
jgi:chromosome segregation ATPase